MSTTKTVNYYNQLGSRLGYMIVAGGHKHFGYYGDKNYWYIPHAAIAMIDYLGKYAGIKKGDKVLDAGCGEGRASLRLAEEFGASVSGIDLVPRSLEIANRRARHTKADVSYQRGDYNKLPFEDKTFDVVFTLETFTHSSDPEKTLKEFWRVLKPGGRIVIFDYSVSDLETGTEEYKRVIETIADRTDCPSFAKIFHDYYQKNLPKWGYKNFEALDKTKVVMRSINQMYALSWLPFQMYKLRGHAFRHPNMLLSHFAKEYVNAGLIRYVNIKITKPK